MCHQSVGLAARTLEEAGIATVVIGSARDILDEVGVPRYVFTDLPLGNPLGPPGDTATQLATLRTALSLADSATGPRTSVQMPVTWPEDDWRDTYMALDDLDELARMGEERRAEQAAAKTARRTG